MKHTILKSLILILALAVSSARSTVSAQDLKEIQITIRLPADALLWFDDGKTESTGESRTFTTPPLATGRRYDYTLKASHAGKTVTRKVSVAHGADNTFDLRADFQTGMAQALQVPIPKTASQVPGPPPGTVMTK
jgi:uncharacterized protein (TIGR03000 family)